MSAKGFASTTDMAEKKITFSEIGPDIYAFTAEGDPNTAVIVGEEDYAAPIDMARHLHESIAGSSLTIIPAARHLTPLETPDIIIDALSDLLERVKAK